jgi:hypothetical protein
MQSPPKTFSAHHAPPLVADLAKVMELYQNDLSDAASIWSSQLLMRHCDDHLNLPNCPMVGVVDVHRHSSPNVHLVHHYAVLCPAACGENPPETRWQAACCAT